MRNVARDFNMVIHDASNDAHARLGVTIEALLWDVPERSKTAHLEYLVWDVLRDVLKFGNRI